MLTKQHTHAYQTTYPRLPNNISTLTKQHTHAYQTTYPSLSNNIPTL